MFYVIDDLSICTWTSFLINKSEAFEVFEELWLKLAKEHNLRLLRNTMIKSYHGKEFENSLFRNFCGKNGIEHEFSIPKTPQ